MPSKKRTILIVPGATGGAWAWQEVASLLRVEGHEVFPITLTGLGERSHLARPDTDLTTHILDVANTIKWNELEGAGIILVGHSYGGTVISGVAEIVPEGTIAAGVFLDAALPEDGQNQYEYMGLEVPEPDGIFAPELAAGHVQTGSSELRAAQLRTPQPIKTFTERLKLTGARERIPTLMYVAGTANRIWERRPAVRRIMDDSRWHWRELPCGHNLYDLPQETADLILEACRLIPDD